MDEKKLAALHAYMLSKGDKIEDIGDEKTFINDMQNEENFKVLHSHLAKTDDYFGKDFNKFKAAYAATPVPQTGVVLESMFKVGQELLPQETQTDRFNAENAEAIKSEQKRQQKPVVETPNFYEQAKPQLTEFAKTVTEKPAINPYDPIQKGVAEIANKTALVKTLLPTVKQETIAGFQINPVNLSTKINPENISDVGLEALKYAQNKEIPNEIRDAIISGDDRLVSNYLVRNDDGFRLRYADKQDLAQAESAFGRTISPKERMAFWENRTSAYAETDENLFKNVQAFGSPAEWLSPYVLLKKGNTQSFGEMLKRIAPNFEQTPEPETQTRVKVDKEIADLSGFSSPEERVMAYYQILANRQKFLQESMFNRAKSVQPKDIQEYYEKNKGNVIADIIGSTQTTGILANLASALPYAGGLVVSPLIRSQISEDQKEWYENAKKLNAVAKYIKQGGAKQNYDNRNTGTLGEQMWEGLKERASDIIPAFERSAFSMLDAPTTSDTRAGTASEQSQIFGQLGLKANVSELKDLKEQQALSQGVTSTEMWAGTAGTQLAIGAMLFGTRGPGVGRIAEVAQDFTKVDRYSRLGKALFSNKASSKALNKLYGLTVSAIGTGLEYEVAGILSGQDKDSEFRKEMGFGSGAMGALGKWFAAPLVNKLSGSKKAIANRLAGAIGEMSEESLQTVYQNWAEYGTNGVLDETLRQIVGEKDASLLDKINNATGFVLSIALMGSLDGDNSQQLHDIKAIFPKVEGITGEKIDEKAFSDIVNGMAEGVKDKPTGISVSESGVDFKINGNEYQYTTEGGAVPLFENADAKEVELANQYGKEILETSQQSNAPQEQQTPTEAQQEPTQETPQVEEIQQAEETPIVETPQIESEQAQPTAEELDSRRAEIAPLLQQVTQDISTLSNEIDEMKNFDPLADNADDIITELEVKSGELATLQQQAKELTQQDADIAQLRQTIKTESEVLAEKTANIQAQLAKNNENLTDLSKKSKEAITNGDFKKTREIQAQINQLKAEKQSLSDELLSLQPQENAEAVSENLTVEDIPIEESVTPETQTPEAQPIVDESLQNMTTFEESVTPIEESIAPETQQEVAKEIVPQEQKKTAEEKAKVVQTPEAPAKENAENEFIAQKPNEQMKSVGYLDSMGELAGKVQVPISYEGSYITKKELEELNKKTQSKTTETPEAPAAPQEEKPAPQKTEKKPNRGDKIGIKKPNVEPNKPKQETRKIKNKKEFTHFLYETGDQTPENRAKAVHTAQLYGEAAKAWAKRTGKSEQEWWNRIESVTIGDNTEGTKGSVQKTTDNTFKVFLITNRDVSTPLHELSHIFQNDLSEAEKATVVKWINDTFKQNFTASQWTWEGGENNGLTPESRDISEFFAKGFEQYLKEGRKVADSKMNPIFAKFAEWLKEVYQDAIQYLGFNIVLNDDMKKLYDTMLGQDKAFAERVKRQTKLQKLIDTDATDPEQVVWNYFANGGQINTKDVEDRFRIAKRGKIPTNVSYISDQGLTKNDIAKQLYDNQVGEKEYEDADFFNEIDAIVDEMGKGFSTTLLSKMEEYAAAKEANQDREALNAEADALIEEERINRENKPTKDELLRMQFQNEIDEAIFGGNTLFQKGGNYEGFVREWEAYIQAVVDVEQAKNNIEQERKDLLAEMEEVSDVFLSPEKKLEIVNTAISKALNPQTDAQKKLSDHADMVAAEAEKVNKIERESLPQEDIENLRDIARKKAESITEDTTQEERIEMRDALIDDFTSKGMAREVATQLVGQYIREMNFGSKFRDKYAPQMSKSLRDAVVDKTYYYGVVNNQTAILKAQELINDWYQTAIEQTAEKWGENADAKNEDFIADTYEALFDIIDNQLFNSKVTNDYYVKVAAALTATKLADTLATKLNGNAKAKVIDKLVSLVDKLAILANGFGKSLNMFGVVANVKGGVLQTIFKKEMAAIISNMSETSKTAKNAIESVINGVSEMVKGLANGKDAALLQELAEAMQNIPAIERLLNRIVEDVTNEQEAVDILNQIDGLEDQKEALIKQIKDKKVLEEKIREKNKEIAALKRKLADKPVTEKPISEARIKQRTAAKAKYESLIDDVVSFGKNLYNNNLFQKIEGFESTLLTTYKEEVINKVNDVMKNITDYVYLGNENASPSDLYRMIQSAARKEFAQKYLEKAEVQPEIPINTNANLTKAEEAKNKQAEAKNKETQAQRQLHADILDAINNDKFRASIEEYLQENREKDIRNQMRKRVAGIVNNTQITEKAKNIELRKVLVQMVAEAATSTNQSAKGVKDFMREYFGIAGKDVTEFEEQFDKLWSAQVKKKQIELIKKRLQTNEEREQKLNDKAVKELMDSLENDKEFGHEFMDDLAKNIRITQGNWEETTANRFREYYHIPLLTETSQKKISDMIKYIDSLPNDTDAKQEAMNVVMTEYLTIVGVTNLDRWVSLVDIMFHVNNLFNIKTQGENIRDSFYQVLHDLTLPIANIFGEIITAMRDDKPFAQALYEAEKANIINSVVVAKTLFSQSTRRLAQNQFSVKEARAVGEYSSFMDYFAKNFSDLPNKLKMFDIGFKKPSELRGLSATQKAAIRAKEIANFITYAVPTALWVFYDFSRLSTVTNALMSGADLALGNTLQMGRMANIISRTGIASQDAMGLADISEAGSRKMDYGGEVQSIDEILKSEREKGFFASQEQILEMWNNALDSGKTEEQAHAEIAEAVKTGKIVSDYKKEWRRKMQLFAEYVEQEYGAWVVADTYRKNATYKNDPTGILGGFYQFLNNTLVRKLRKREIDAREKYNRNQTAANLVNQKFWQFLKIAAERIAGTAYLRTKLNILSKKLGNMFFFSIIRAIKNRIGYMDTEAAMRKAIDSEGKLTPNSLWHIDDLVHKGFLFDAQKKIREDVDAIKTKALKDKQKIIDRENAEIEKIDKEIASKQKVLVEKIKNTEDLSKKKQDAIDRKLKYRQEIIDSYLRDKANLSKVFDNKNLEIASKTLKKIESLKSKIEDLLTKGMKDIDTSIIKSLKVREGVTQYIEKYSSISAKLSSVDSNIKNEIDSYESTLSGLEAQNRAISEGLGVKDKAVFSEFVSSKKAKLLELHTKKITPLYKSKERLEKEKENAKTQYEILISQYMNKQASVANKIQTAVSEALQKIESDIAELELKANNEIAKVAEQRDIKLASIVDVTNKRVESLDYELNVAINVEKKRYDRHIEYLNNVFNTEKAKLESQKKIIADRAKVDRRNINNLKRDKLAPLNKDIAKIGKKISAYTESYKIGVADQTARMIRIATVDALIGYSAYKFFSAILGGDDDEEEPMIDVVGDIIPQQDGTKIQNQNQDEVNSKLKIIFRAFGEQWSIPFPSLVMSNDLLAWGVIFDRLKERKRGIITDKKVVDIVSRPILTSIQQIFAFRDMETLNFADPFVEPSEKAVRIAANLSPIKMPSIGKFITSDLYYRGQGYSTPEDETYFQQYLRLIGMHPEWIGTKDSEFAKEYSVIDGQPLYRYPGDNTNEINRILSQKLWGKETSTSFNDFIVKPDRLHVLYKEMEFRKWLYYTGVTDVINITNPQEVVPVMAENVLLGTKPLPKNEFQEFVVKPTAQKASDKLRKMYKDKFYNNRTEAQIIESVKNFTAGEEATKDFLKSDRTNRAALNIGLKYVVKKLWEDTKKEVLGDYLRNKKPQYKQLGENITNYKHRIEKK